MEILAQSSANFALTLLSVFNQTYLIVPIQPPGCNIAINVSLYLGTHILGASPGGPCDSTALVIKHIPKLIIFGTHNLQIINIIHSPMNYC